MRDIIEQLRKRLSEPDMAVISSQMARDGRKWVLDALHDRLAEVEALRAELFAARDAVLKEGMEADRLRAEVERLETRLRMGPDWDG